MAETKAKVRLLTSRATMLAGQKAGQTIEVSEIEAGRLVLTGQAEWPDDAPKGARDSAEKLGRKSLERDQESVAVSRPEIAKQRRERAAGLRRRRTFGGGEGASGRGKPVETATKTE